MSDIDDDRRFDDAVLVGGSGRDMGLDGAAAHAVRRSGRIMLSTHVDVPAELTGLGADLEPTT